MYRIILLVVCCVLTACASVSQSNSKPIRVSGAGTTIESAKQNAFRKAIEIQVGVIILSERETQNQQMVKNQILAYSSGYVDDFKVIDQHSTNNHTTITVDVWVASSRLSQMFLSNSKAPAELAGEKHSIQYNSYLQNRVDGDAVLGNILKGYPYNAFVIQQGPHVFGLDAYRNAILEVPFTMKWSNDYITSLHEVLGLLEEGSNGFRERSPGNVRILGNGKKTLYQFNDVIRTDQIKKAMTGYQEVNINVAILNSRNKIVYSKCMDLSKPPFLYAPIGDVTTIYGNSRFDSKVQLRIEPKSYLNSILQDAHRIELSAVPLSSCNITQKLL